MCLRLKLIRLEGADFTAFALAAQAWCRLLCDRRSLGNDRSVSRARHSSILLADMFMPLTGQAFDAHSLLGEVCIARMKADLIEINNKRASSKPPRPLYPPINCSWIVAPFKSDSRMTHSITRRGYRTLEEYLESYPDTNMDAFPPKREIFIPKQCTLLFASGCRLRPVADICSHDTLQSFTPGQSTSLPSPTQRISVDLRKDFPVVVNPKLETVSHSHPHSLAI